MANGQGWLFPDTSVETILKARPLALGLFEGFGLNPWKAPRESLGDLCRDAGVPWDPVMAGLAGMQVPAADTDWKSLPVYHLLDYLTWQHREFLLGYLPAIGHVLSDIRDADPETLLRMRTLAVEWPAFAASLGAHIREEEDIFFLRILRYDSCRRLGHPEPDFEGGSVRVFTVVRLLEHEHRDMALMRRFLERGMPTFPVCGGEVLDRRLRPLIIELQAALAGHARLESEVLIPWGIGLEKSLYDLHIRGSGFSPSASSRASRG